MAIYTRTGDKGKTSLSNGKRVSKVDLRIEALGAIDELNSAIGVAIAELGINDKGLRIRNELIGIQNDLLEIGSNLADTSLISQLSFLISRTKELERLIDEMTKQMPKLSSFILPGGGRAGAMLHLARAVCRRTERRVVALNNKQKIDDSIVTYFNRLSDLLFTMARFVNFKEKKKELVWNKKRI